MRIDVLTLFPEWFDWFWSQRHIRNLQELDHEFNCVDMRDTTPISNRRVDDAPYGGGAGMVIRVDVVEAALREMFGSDPVERVAGRRVIALSPTGRKLDEDLALELAAQEHLVLLCGRYEGFDERVHEHFATDVVSIGDYVLAGGELAAMVVADAVTRKLPGSLGHEMSAQEESFSASLEGHPEYPHYTRPEDHRGWLVPDILLSGDHGKIAKWRLEQSRARGGARKAADGPPAGD